jgi:hypothetical protein
MINLVNEEQGQHLDALVEQLTLTLDMGENRLSNLDPAQLVLINFAHHITRVKLDAVDKFDGIISAINALHDEAVSIFGSSPEWSKRL